MSFAWLKALLRSRKFWLCAVAVLAAYLTGQERLIPWLIVVEIGGIAAEDVAQKLGAARRTAGAVLPAERAEGRE